MEGKYFFLKLIPPRPSFAFDMTAAERQAMQAHVQYWTDLTKAGTAIIYGPVMDPVAPYGIGIVEVEGEDSARRLAAEDPAITGGTGCTYELLPMRVGLIRGMAM